MTTQPEKILIVGFGAAGLTAAQTLRQDGWSGKLTILSKEDEPPYDRPPLSKQFLSGDYGIDKILLASPERIESLRADIRYGTEAIMLDTSLRTVVDSQSFTHHYDELMIATGVSPRSFNVPDHPHIHVLRTRTDAERLRGDLYVGQKLVIIGGGFLGLETASTARKIGLDVTVVEPLPLPLETRLGEPVARKLVALHESHGVKVIAGVGVREIAHKVSVDPRTDQLPLAVVLTDGRAIAADVVLVAVGSVTETSWLESSTLSLDNGIVCDEFCRASDGVWAAGDVANWRNLETGSQLRLEHRMNATEQGRAVAKNILGPKQAFKPVPFFWTDQYDIRIQSAGRFNPEDTSEFVHGEFDSDSFVVAYHQDGLLQGALNWNAARAMIPLRQQLASQLAGVEGE